MNKRGIFGGCVLSLVACVASLAQPLAAPKEPLPARAPAVAEWKISYRFDHDSAKQELLNPDANKKSEAGATKVQGRFPKETTISKDGKTYSEVTLWSDGIRTEKWIIDGLEVQDTPGGNVVQVMLPTSFYSSDYSDYARSDFENVEWVSLGNYTGTQKYNGAEVYAFATTGDKKRRTPRETADIASGNVRLDKAVEQARRCEAFLDPKTQLPLYLDDGEVIRIYTYSQAPAGKLTPPPKFAKALDDWKKEIKQKTSVPLAP